MGTYINIEDPDDMLHNATFYQGLPCIGISLTLFQIYLLS